MKYIEPMQQLSSGCPICRRPRFITPWHELRPFCEAHEYLERNTRPPANGDEARRHRALMTVYERHGLEVGGVIDHD